MVIALNGTGHLRQLRTFVAAARGDDPSAIGERVRLDDGESLAKSFFARVTRRDFVAELRVPTPDPIAINGAYRFDDLTGCSATDHPHKDREESFWMMYRGTRHWPLCSITTVWPAHCKATCFVLPRWTP